MDQFSDSEFDVVFSNGVIECIGDYDDQKQMADEIRRVGKRYFVEALSSVDSKPAREGRFKTDHCEGYFLSLARLPFDAQALSLRR